MTNHALKFGSVCSGIEAASVAWHPLGWKTAWVSEIDPFASAVLAHHYSDVPNLGDMTQLPQRILSGEVEAPEVFCGGTPCQAFSVAGLRQSLKDDRGNLSLTFVDIANAIDTVRVERGDLPAIIFWENVPGVLSTKDNAFGCFLAGLAGEDVPLEPPRGKWTDAGAVLGPKRTVAWRILDAQYFGLAQRRRRVFVVASARGGFDPTAILFESEGLRRDSAPSREAGQKATGSLTARAGRNLGQANDDVDGHKLITMAHGQGGAEIGFDRGPTLTCNHEAPILAHALRGEGFDASEDGTGRGTPLVPVHRDLAPTLTSNYGKQPDSSDTNAGPMLISMVVPDVAGTMKACKDSGGWSNSADHAAAGHMVPVAHAFDARQSNVIQYGDKTGPLDTNGHTIGVAVDLYNQTITGDVAGSLTTTGGGPLSGPSVMQPVGVTLHGTAGTQSVASFTDLSSSLRARIPSGVENSTTTAVMQPMAFSSKDYGADATADLSPTLRAMNHADSHANGGGQMAVAWSIMPQNSGRDYKARPVDVLQPLMAAGPQHGNQGGDIIQTAMQVRRLTPRECERLQGFPDDYTMIPWRNKPASECPDGPRYKALGNSWAVPCVRWIGERIDAELKNEHD